jgi:hypothetical protein
MCVSSYSKVGAIEQRYMVNSGVWGKKDSNPRSGGLVFYSNTGRIPIIYPITYKYRVPVIYTTGTPGDFVVASGSSLVLPRAAADTRWQCSTLHYTEGSAVCYAMQGQQQRGAGEEERRRDEGTGDGAKEVARTAGFKAAGARVIGG